MKFIHVTDTHLLAPGKLKKGVDVGANLAATVREINRRHRDAAFCVISGDLTDDGRPGQYAHLKSLIASLEIPVHLMIGNHDRRNRFIAAFPDAPLDENGFVQHEIDTPEGVFLLLDTVTAPGSAGGTLCAARLAWLQTRIARHAGRDLYVFLHHPPFRSHIPSMDAIGLANPDPLAALLTAHGRVRQIFVGHLHRPVGGLWRGLPWSAQPSTYRQIPLRLSTGETEEASAPAGVLPPCYGIVFVEGGDVVCHTDCVPAATA